MIHLNPQNRDGAHKGNVELSTLTLNAFILTLVLVAAGAGSLQAVVPPGGSSPVAGLQYRHPDVDFRAVYQRPSELPTADAGRAQVALSALGIDAGAALLDPRGGRWGTLILAKPLIPGSGDGNHLSWSRLGLAPPADRAALEQAAWQALTDYLAANEAALHIRTDELSPEHRITIHDDGDLVQIYAPRVVSGVTVRSSYLTAAIRGGNLVLLGTHGWGEVAVSTAPLLSTDEATASALDYLGSIEIDGSWNKPELILLPMARGRKPAEITVGEGYDHRLAWAQRLQIEGESGRWELLVDAHTGEVLAFEDTASYATTRQVTGGVYPLSNDGVGLDGVEQAGWPMPIDVAATAVGASTADSGGNLPICIDGDISSSLEGQFITIHDFCGDPSLTSAADLDFDTHTGTDCTTPGTGGDGNTHASRTAFYQLNRIREQALGQLPANSWLQDQLTANTNYFIGCNAAWDGSEVIYLCSATAAQGGSSFPTGCANTGELAGAIDHEWGHGMDNNDAIPTISSPGEGIADVYAYLATDTSCIGRGFRIGTQCGGYGDACTACDGARDIDYTARASLLPHDVASASPTGIDALCTSGTSNGPCGGEVHCEGAVTSEAVYDLINTDLPGLFGMDHNTALEVGTRLTYVGAGAVGNWFQCTSPYGGCNADGGYLNYLVADDDNANINDGTPHMSAIFAAFDRHGIACDVPAVVDSGCAGTPAVAPVVVAAPLDRGVSLSWGAVAGATEYQILRTDGVSACAFGKARVGETTGTSFIDDGLQNGRAYSYLVVPIGAGDACIGPASACTAVTPAAGSNLAVDEESVAFSVVFGDADNFLDNCETGRVTFDVHNIGTGSLTDVRIVGVTSPSHPLISFTTTFPETINASMAECDVDTGSFDLVGDGLSFDDTVELEVEVTADELAASRTFSLLLEHAESDYQSFLTQTFTYEADIEDWQVIEGTFDRTDAGGGAQATTYYVTSSSNLANHCDHVRSPLIRLSATSTLETYSQIDIEPECPFYPICGIFCCAQWADRANVGIYDLDNDLRSPVDPDGGRVYNGSGPFTQGSCDMDGENGWVGTDLTWSPSTWSSTALRTAIFNGREVQLDIRYGTDPNVSLSGFHFDQVTLTDFEIQVPDTQTDTCIGAFSFNDADGDSVPNSIDLCRGDDGDGDGDGDGVCTDVDCDDGDPAVAYLDSCGVCGGDNSSCGGAPLTLDPATVALWHLDGDGTDAGGFGYDLSVKPDRVAWMTGKFGQAAEMGTDPWGGDCLNSDGGALTSPGHGITYTGDGDWMIEAWIKADAYDQERTVLSHFSEHWEGHEPYQLRLLAGGELSFSVTDSSDQTDSVSAFLSAPAGTWVNVAAIYRAFGSLEIYEDFVLVAQQGTDLVPETLSQYDGYLGGTFCGTSDGLTIDEVRISDAARYPGCLLSPADDPDCDGTCNAFDSCPGIGCAADSDADGTPDGCDLCPGFDDNLDADGDGTADGCDLCPGFDDSLDADADGVPDDCDLCEGFDDNDDDDADGVPDECDICFGSNATGDADTDGICDDLDVCPGFDDSLDADGDGVADGCDLCPGFNDSLDADADGVPDGCDLCEGSDATGDSDGDDICDDLDVCPGFDDSADDDGDGVADGCDLCEGFDDNADDDGDGTPDDCDVCAGFDDNADDDDDGIPDGCDPCDGFNALAVIAVDNFSFEEPVLANGTATGSVPSWIQVAGISGIYNPTTVLYPAGVTDGDNCSYSAGATIGQTIAAEALIADTTYTLKVDVGNREDLAFPGYQIQLLIGGAVRASADETLMTPAVGTFATATASFTATPADAGLSLEIRLLSVGTQTDFDNLRLTRLTCGNEPPVVSITAPADGSSFSGGTSVSFAGSASDAEDGDLGPDLSWTSSREGTIGSGAAFSTSILSCGDHAITAAVTDSGGLPETDQIAVTVTGNAAVPITVDNFSFEEPPLADGTGTGSVPSWTQVAGVSGIYNPTTVQFSAGVTDGSNCSYSAGATIGQTIATEALIADTVYSLVVDVGNRADLAFPGYQIQLLVGGAVRASADETLVAPADDTFATATASFTTTPADAGLSLEVRLVSAGNQVNFDNVRLTRDDDADADGVPDGCDVCEGDDATGDTDLDGVCDDLDQCLGDDAAGDGDADGVCDDLDICEGFDDAIDSDGDGVPDGCDICAGNDATGDGDGDGVCNDLDLCLGNDATGDGDGDGVCDDLDLCEGFDDAIDSDGDGVPDGCDICPGFDDNIDSDDDGVPNGCDVCEGSDADGDGDGVPDGCDICPGFDDSQDADADGVPDGCDICEGSDDSLDDDADGVPDGCDVCEGFDDNLDDDADGVPDGCDVCEGFDDSLDDDADGVPDGCDVCEGFDDSLDDDADGVPDGCDVCEGFDDNLDDDADGVPDGCDLCEGFDDNLDDDADGVPDGCDVCEGSDDSLDDDADGVPDGCDVCEGFDDNLDDDADGVPDGCDICEGFDDNLDDDADGVPDGCDLCEGFDDNLDDDADGVPDGCDLCEGFDDNLDDDADGVPDGCDLCQGNDATGDSDGDGICDDLDQCQGNDASGDTDGDGVCDDLDACEGFDDADDADDDGVPDGCDDCDGDDALGDADGDDLCADLDCDDDDPDITYPDTCGVCGGDDSSCTIFSDSFESGDASIWSLITP